MKKIKDILQNATKVVHLVSKFEEGNLRGDAQVFPSSFFKSFAFKK